MEYLKASSHELSFGDLIFIEDKLAKEKAARAGSAAELVLLENKKLHEYLFRDVVWSAEEARIKRTGLYIDTIEFNPVQRFLFRQERHPALASFASTIGFPRFIAGQDATLYATGAALVALTMTSGSSEDFLMAGRLLQRTWLKATELWMYMQPITATLFLAQRVIDEKDKMLSPEHRKLMAEADANIRAAFDLTDSTVPVMFRIGYAEEPSAISSRIPPRDKLLANV